MEMTSYQYSYNQSNVKKLIDIANKIGSSPNIDDDTKEVLRAMLDILFEKTIEKR